MGEGSSKNTAFHHLLEISVKILLLFPTLQSTQYRQDLSQKNFAPRVPGIEQFGILDGSEKMSTTTGTKVTNAYQRYTYALH